MITSVQNPLVKYVVKLKHKSSFRRKEQKFVVEGRKEIARALKGNFSLEKLFYCSEIMSDYNLLENIPANEKIQVSKKVYEHIAYRGGTEGVLAVGIQKPFVFKGDCISENPFVLVAERIQKPGNIGALLRTTDAVGTGCVFFIDPQTDLYNPNVIRASLGTIFTQRITVISLEEFRRIKEAYSIRLFAATLQNANVYWKENYKGNIAIAVGAEDTGISEELRDLADKQIYIPMKGAADSLNVSVSAAVLLYEVLRQKSIS